MNIKASGGLGIEISYENILLLAACVPDACFPSDLFGTLGSDSACQIKGESKQLDGSDIACM